MNKNISSFRYRCTAVLLMFFDIAAVFGVYWLALYISYGCELDSIPVPTFETYYKSIAVYLLPCLAIYWHARMYNSIWRLVSFNELYRFGFAVMLTACGYCAVMRFLREPLPLRYFFIGGWLQLTLLVPVRFFYRVLVRLYGHYLNVYHPDRVRKRTMLIGAGSAGKIILQDIFSDPYADLKICCIIDDNLSKRNCTLEGIPIVGGRNEIADNVRKYSIEEILFAVPSIGGKDKKAILDICKETGCRLRILPGIGQLVNGDVSLAKMKDVAVEDLLGRDPVQVNTDDILKNMTGRIILVTGGGGSIGSELCRQIASYNPKSLIIFDIYENNAYDIEQELKRNFPGLNLVVLIGSVRDTRRLDDVFRTFRPEIVFHAASHKHVPLMEYSPCESIKNNVMGTYKTACAAIECGCRQFFYLSTDKAVNPTSILGASNRICEMLMQTMEHLVRTGKTDKLFPPSEHKSAPVCPDNCRIEFASIRFGTVIGSEGSFFNLFKKQIAEGGPVKVTHKNVTRFCMTCPEIVQLILQASVYARDGEVFVLDMGTPFKIDTLARNLIRLNGLVPDKDIAIEYIGLRPGEKMFEEPLMWEEGMRKTPCPRIYVANPTRIDIDGFLQHLQDFFRAAVENSRDIRTMFGGVVNSYHSSDVSTEKAQLSEKSEESESINHLECVALSFQIRGKINAIVPITKGYINRTYCVESQDTDGTRLRYTLQRINTDVFKEPDKLMDNFVRVTEHLAKNLHLPWNPDSPANQRVIMTMDGKPFFSDFSGAWRMLTYFENVHSYDIPKSSAVFHDSGVVFGLFAKAMNNFPGTMPFEIIPDFHNTFKRYEALEKAIQENPVGRLDNVGKEVEFIRKHRDVFRLISDALESGQIPLRIAHNDCNLNNVLFDDATDRPAAVIDLDTVMPSTILYDFGDSMRIGTNTAKDDEKDLSKVRCDLNLYEAYARGWLEACGDTLTEKELELLPYASIIISFEDGIRFLMDYLNGDTYYYIYYLGQNLDRARTQLKLAEDMLQKLPEIKKILPRILKDLGIKIPTSMLETERKSA